MLLITCNGQFTKVASSIIYYNVVSRTGLYPLGSAQLQMTMLGFKGSEGRKILVVSFLKNLSLLVKLWGRGSGRRRCQAIDYRPSAFFTEQMLLRDVFVLANE